jgi:hypothetical protein
MALASKHAIGIDNEGAAPRHPRIFAVGSEIATKFHRRFGTYGEGNPIHKWSIAGSDPVCSGCVHAHGKDLGAHLAESIVIRDDFFQLGDADAGEVDRIEEENQPLSLTVGELDLPDFVALINVEGEIVDFLSNANHDGFRVVQA